MSKLQLGHSLQLIYKKNFYDQLSHCLDDIDSDMIGLNGPEYTSKEALNAGFNSTASYVAHEVIKEFNVTPLAVANFICETLGDDDYYKEIEYSIIDQPDVFIVGIAYTFYE